MNAPPPRLWSAGGASVPGASHLRRGVPNQDAIAWSPGEAGAVAVLALSDGHGSAAHARSDVGARLAVEAAQAVLTRALGDGAALPDPLAVGGEVVAAWREAAGAHLAAHPPGAGEPGGEPLHLYGATLVVAAAAPAGILVLQLGDGDLLARRADGTIERPLPDDPGLLGEQTYSLCLRDAERHLRAAILPDPDAVELLMLSTDGLSKSFADDADFRRLAGTWDEALRALGLAGVVEALPEWLSAASARGSGDDITLGFLLREGRAAARPTARHAAAAGRPAPARGGLAAVLLRLLRRAVARRPGSSAPLPASPLRSESGDLP